LGGISSEFPARTFLRNVFGNHGCVMLRASGCIDARIGQSRPFAPIGDFPGSGLARGRQVVRAEPMSTLDAELNDFGAQLAMLEVHCAM
jgi:hypothetical protein